MKNSESLEKMAGDQDWLSFAKSLSAAMREPEKYGFTDVNRLLAQVALLRSMDPSSLRIPLAAFSWLEKNAPEALELPGKKVPATGVITLSQITELSKETGSEIASKFFFGALKRKDLKSILADLQRKNGERGVLGHERYKNTVEFEEKVRDYLAENKGAGGLTPDADFVSSCKDSVVPSDLTMLSKGKPVAAILIKSHRQKRHHRHLVETIAMAALLANEYGRAILIVPGSWGTAIAEMNEIIQRLKLDKLRLLVFHDEPDFDSGDRLQVPGYEWPVPQQKNPN